MRETKAIIERVRRINTQWQHLELAVEPELAQIQPGQTLLARMGESFEPYLREQWIPLGYNPAEGVLIVERPLSRLYLTGDEVSLIGPVGTAFALKRNIRNLLLVALDAPPTRLLALMLQALGENVGVLLVLTASAQEYPLVNLPPAVEVIKSPDILTWEKQAESLAWADQIFAVTSPFYCNDYYSQLLERATDARRALPEHFLNGVYTLSIPCGTGACFACMVRRKHQDQLICVHGPAFDLSQMSF